MYPFLQIEPLKSLLDRSIFYYLQYLNNYLGLLILNYKFSLRRNRMLRQPLLFWSAYLSIQFFNSDTLVSDLRDTMPRQRSLTRIHM